MRRWLAPALLLAALIGLWQIAADTGAPNVLGLEDFLVPSPSQIATTLWRTARCSPTTPG